MPEMPFPSMLEAITLDYKISKHMHSMIADFRNDGMLIYPPDRKGTAFNLSVGGRVTVRFCGDEGVCEFSSTVLKKVKEPFISYLLSFPDQVNVVQRREFYRLKVRDLTLNYCLVSRKEAEGKLDPNKLPSKEYYQGIIYDISGRGVSFLIGERKEEIQPKKFLHLKIDLDTDFIESYAQVVRQFSIDDEVYAGTALVGLKKNRADKIIAYIFKTQREKRRNILRLRWSSWKMEQR